MFRKFTIGMLVAAGLLVSACNTLEGIGKDVKSAGEKVEDVAK